MDNIIALVRDQGLKIDPEKASYFIGRENLIISKVPAMSRWRANLFVVMSRNATGATLFFRIPAEQAIEIGVRIEI